MNPSNVVIRCLGRSNERPAFSALHRGVTSTRLHYVDGRLIACRPTLGQYLLNYQSDYLSSMRVFSSKLDIGFSIGFRANIRIATNDRGYHFPERTYNEIQ